MCNRTMKPAIDASMTLRGRHRRPRSPEKGHFHEYRTRNIGPHPRHLGHRVLCPTGLTGTSMGATRPQSAADAGPLYALVCGPLTRWLVHRLNGRPTVAQPPPTRAIDPLTSVDYQRTLHLLYELDFRDVAGVNPDWERDRVILDFRARLEDGFLTAVMALVAADGGERWVRQASIDGPGPTLDALLVEFDGPSLSTFMAEQGDRDQFLEFMIHRSAYQLKEADPHTFGLPRLVPGPRKAAYAEIQFDEYGGGAPGRSHAELFAQAMAAAGLDSTYGHYIDVLPAITLATGNLLSLFAARRRFLPHLVGHLALFEMTSVAPMTRYAAAAARLRFAPPVRAFYDVHVEADEHHGRLAREVLLGVSSDSSPPGTDGLDAGEMFTGAHALLLVEDRFARHLLERWKAGRSSLHHMDPVDETNQAPVAHGLGSCLPADHRA